MKQRRVIASALFLIFFSILFFIRKGGEETPKEYFIEAGKVFGTSFEITYEADRNLRNEIEEELKRFDHSLSTFNKQSTISKVNQNDPNVVLDEWFLTVFNKSMEVSSKTEGAFDITVAPLVNAWGFGFKKKEQVTPHLIDSLLQYVGYHKVKLEQGKVVKQQQGIMLDCSAIAKGYGCDIIGQLLNKLGCNNFLVEIGGEVACKGSNPEGNKWRIGINKPSEDGGKKIVVEEVVAFTDGGMATSGNYRNFYYEGGKRYAHTIDPKTGYPIEHSLLSATVFAPDCMTADAYATAFMVLGLEKSIQIVEADPALEAYFIYTDGTDQYKIRYSEGVKQLLKPS